MVGSSANLFSQGFPFFQAWDSMYKKHFGGFSDPPVAFTIPAQSSVADCTMEMKSSSAIFSLTMCSKSESLTKITAARVKRKPVQALYRPTP